MKYRIPTSPQRFKHSIDVCSERASNVDLSLLRRAQAGFSHCEQHPIPNEHRPHFSRDHKQRPWLGVFKSPLLEQVVESLSQLIRPHPVTVK
jgi:hypothetical protein